MEFEKDKQEMQTVIRLKERNLNAVVSPDLKSEFVVLSSEGVKSIILDMEEVAFVDSSGLSAILIGNRMCKSAGGVFVITNVQENVAKLIKISQLNTILNIIPSVEEAIDFIIMESAERDIKDEE